MDTITVKTGNDQTVEIPVAAALGADGQPAELIGDIEPWGCDHTGQMWSDCLDLRCRRCGVRLFLPGRFLAFRSAEEIEGMQILWCAAGCPPWYPSGWGITPGYWTIIPIGQFAALGGLPILNERVASIREDVRFSLAEKLKVE